MCGERCSVLCLQWRLWIRPLVFTVYGAFLFGLLPYIIYRLVQTGVQSSTFAWLVGGIFVILTIPLSLWEIVQHLVNYTKPKLQKHIIRILWMVPIYSLDAWLVLWEPQLGLYLDTARECYEAYVIYNFMIFLLNFLDEEMDLEAALDIKPTTPHFFPLCCLRPWPMGREFIHRCKHGILQYTVFHLMTTGIAFVCGLAGIYGEGNFSPNYAFIYLFIVNNASQFAAMYCLVLFYRAMREELNPMKPLAKFLCIKCVVFFSFFQGVGIMFLVKARVIKQVFGVSEEDELKRISNILQNFLICVEMFIAAVGHRYAFSYKPYVDPDYMGANCCHAFLLIWDISDVRSDIREHVHIVSQGMTRSLSSRGKVSKWPGTPRDGEGGRGSERTRLIPPESR
ncbi:UNVERIFIED_CONTAM: hypothetical protein GTU68_056096, partial [Idotea baltica]|nr:hypothetical protein [Idotea baltica]